jgi:hypothetical protein
MRKIFIAQLEQVSMIGNHLKFMHRVKDDKMKAKVDFGLDHFFQSREMPPDFSSQVSGVGVPVFYWHIILFLMYYYYIKEWL